MIIYASILDSGFIIFSAATIFILVMVTGIIQPYKKSIHTKTDILFMGALGLFVCIDEAMNHQSLRPPTEYKVSTALRNIVGLIPLCYMLCKILYWVLKRVKKLKFILTRVNAWRRGYEEIEEDYEASLPDRMINPVDYHQGHNQSLGRVSSHSNNKIETNLTPITTY